MLQLLSAAEDSFVRVWHLTMTPESNTVEVTFLLPWLWFSGLGLENTSQRIAVYSLGHGSITLRLYLVLDFPYVQWVCDGHSDLRRKVLWRRRLRLWGHWLRPQWDHPLHTVIGRRGENRYIVLWCRHRRHSAPGVLWTSKTRGMFNSCWWSGRA